MKTYTNNLKSWYWYLALLIFSFFILSYKLTEIPPGINGDEASIGYNAALLSQTLHDENGRFMPLFVLTLDGVDWKQPLTIYPTALIFKVLGISYFNLRLVSVLYCLISALLLFYLLKQLLSTKTAFLSLLLLLTTPIIFIQSHLALENIAPVPFILLWLIFLHKFTKLKQGKYLFFSGLGLGLSIFSYNGMRLMVPVMTILTVIYLYYISATIKASFRKIVTYFLLGILPFILVILLTKSLYPGAILGNNRPKLVPTYQQFFSNYLSNFDPSFLFISGDVTPYHSTGKQGVFLLASAPLFLWGLLQVLKEKNNFFRFVLAVFIFAPLLFGFTNSFHRGSRILALVPLYILIASLALEQLLSNSSILKKLILGCIIGLVILNFADFIKDYWFEYNKRVKQDFTKPIQLTLKDLNQNSQRMSLEPAIEKEVYQAGHIPMKFFELAYFGKEIKKISSQNTLPTNVLMLGVTNQVFLDTSVSIATTSSQLPDFKLYSITKQ